MDGLGLDMLNAETYSVKVTAVPSGVDGAVGVPESKVSWYVGVVNARHEKKVSESLRGLGVDSFVATQRELRVWKNGRRKIVDRVVIPSVVFIRCTEPIRRELTTLPYIHRFMVNRMADTGMRNKPAATIPDNQMSVLKFMLGHSDQPVNFVPAVLKVHDPVRVIRGKLKGLEGFITADPEGGHVLTVSLDILGGATVKIDPHDVQPL